MKSEDTTKKSVKSTAKSTEKSEKASIAQKSTPETSKVKTKKVEKTDPKDVVSDYNGYDYKKIFWEDADRAYEDQADRMAIRKLLPKHMETFVDVAGGYGRLAKEYLDRADDVTIFDYSQSELDDAKKEFKDRVHTVQGDIYNMPFAKNSFSALLMVRATHHLKNMPKAAEELHRILKPGGVAVVEVANKKTLPKMVRFLTFRSKVNPFDKNPSDLGLGKDGFYNYHPKYIEKIFESAGFEIAEILSVSNFRSATMKKVFKTDTLVKMENAAQKPFAKMRFAPSIYYKLIKINPESDDIVGNE